MDVVTGATGHLGGVLVRRLAAAGREVRAVVRPASDPARLAGVDLEIARADLLSPDSLVRAFRGAELVYHAAGNVQFGIGHREALRAVNLEGTQNVVRACRLAGVRRLVYVSSIEALDLSAREGPVTEEVGFHPDRTVMEYGRSKALASLAVLEAASAGLDAVVVCPTGYVGPEDYRLSAMGRLVLDYVRGRIPLVVAGGFDFVDVRDVAEGTVAAADRGRSGESYILSGTYLEVSDIMRALEALTGVRAPTLLLPGPLALGFARVAELWYSVRHAPPRFTTGSVRILSLGLRVSSEKARRELGYLARPFDKTLEDTLAWLADAGFLGEPGTARQASP
jgi:dihydroflavonol-4-reductase